MPLIVHKEVKNNFKLGIWSMTEDLEELTLVVALSSNEKQKILSFKSNIRKREWLCTRLLLQELLSSNNFSIEYDENGKPFLKNSPFHISITHTRNYVAVILSENGTTGIDIEVVHPRIEKIIHKFVSSDEARFLSPENRLDQYYVLWGAKEVLYKIYGKGELHFSRNLICEKFIYRDKGELKASIIKNDFKKTFNVFYEKHDELMLVYAVE